MLYLLQHSSVPYFLVILGFVFTHLFSKYMAFKAENIRKFISFSGGVGVSFVVMNLFPYLPYSQTVLNRTFGWGVDSMHRYTIYVVVLLGLSLAYTLYKFDIEEVKKLKKKDPALARSFSFWSNISFFAIYNVMIGYLVGSGYLHENTNLWVYLVAFSLHFFVNDCVLRHHYSKKYDQTGWLVLAVSVFVGGMFALLVQLPTHVVVLFKALITGAMILNVIRFELPSENRSSLPWFWLGTICAAVLFMAV